MSAKFLGMLGELGLLVLSFLKEKGVIDEFIKILEKKVADSDSKIDDTLLMLIKLAI